MKTLCVCRYADSCRFTLSPFVFFTHSGRKNTLNGAFFLLISAQIAVSVQVLDAQKLHKKPLLSSFRLQMMLGEEAKFCHFILHETTLFKFTRHMRIGVCPYLRVTGTAPGLCFFYQINVGRFFFSSYLCRPKLHRNIFLYIINQITKLNNEKTAYLTSLTAETTYDYQVKSVKDGEEDSDWSDIATFTTLSSITWPTTTAEQLKGTAPSSMQTTARLPR